MSDEYRGWPEDRVDTPEMAKLRAEWEEARHERDQVQATVSEHKTAWARVNQENDKLRAEKQKAERDYDAMWHDCTKLRVDLTKAEASIVEHKATERRLRAENERLRKWIRVNGATAAADYACATCVPYSTVLIPGFVCGYHLAVAALSEGDPRG